MANQRINVSFFHEIVTANDCRKQFVAKPDLNQKIRELPYVLAKCIRALNIIVLFQ